MKKITALILYSLLTTMALRADVIFQELFPYSDTINNATMITNSSGGLWILHSATAPGQGGNVKGHRLEVSSSSGGNGLAPARTDDIHRLLSVTNNSTFTNQQQVLYASYVVNFTNLPAGVGVYFAHFYVSSTTFPGRLWAQTNGTVLPNTFRLGISSGATISKVYPVDLALNTDYQVVIGYCPVTGDPGGLTDDSTTLWINPVSPSDTPVISGDSFAPGTSIANSYAFRQASSFGGFLTVSNLVLATTFAEALTNVLSTNAVAPKIVYQPPPATTNYQNAAVSVSAVANGQGLGSLTYQWQSSTSPANTSPVNVTNPNGNTNVLSVDTSTTGIKYYTLVVTTPYGLSATSSVAKVTILLPNGPPSFIIQPGSKNAYTGQTVTFSTTVLSPGNISYTWYSNNVVISSTASPVGQTDNGSSSSLELDNVQTSFSATYKVAVTNDTAANGIVSTNAVLTVNNPQAVTIAYLRSLQDPNNSYLPSPNPSTAPYQITGTVTTFTNVTFGNTSSYYLQDGTAGINIFATQPAGALFRPAQGDVVTFVGILSGFSSGLELYADTADSLYPFTSFTDTGTTNALPAPISIGYDVTTNLNNVNFNLAGSLVKITDVYFGTNAGVVLPTTANYTATVTNSSGQAFKLTFFEVDLDTAGQTLPAYAYSVTGVLTGINTNFSIGVTRFADLNTTAPPTPIPLGLSVAGGNLTFNWTDASFVLQDSTNVTGPYSTILGASTGFSTNTTSAPTLFFRLYHP